MKSEIDTKPFVQGAIDLLERKLQGDGLGKDQNLLSAIEILRNYQPSMMPKPESDASEGLVIAAWDNFVEPEVAKYARPLSLRKRTLFVAVENGPWHTEIVRYRAKGILQKCQAAVGAETVRSISYQLGTCLQTQGVLFMLPGPVFSRCRKLQSPAEAGRSSALEWAREALKEVSESAQVRLVVNFDKLPGTDPVPDPGQTILTRVGHLKAGERVSAMAALPEEFHFFEELMADLEVAMERASEFAEQDGADPQTSLARGTQLIAARRWSKGKEAEATGDQNRASEMKAFATFWYRLTEHLNAWAQKEQNPK